MGDDHHFIFGTLEDVLTGETLTDTHDERYRQQIASLLINEKGFSSKDIRPRIEIFARAGIKSAIARIDFLIDIDSKACMMIRYAPGSITTRHRPSLAAARVVEPYQIPVVVVTNGVDADILNGETGKVSGSGLENIPDKTELVRVRGDFSFKKLSEDRVEKESRILYTFDIEDSCETNCMIDYRDYNK